MAASSDDAGWDIVIPWKLQNDFDTFLNQCCIQSFLFLLQSLRDGNSALWLDNFTRPAISDGDLPSPLGAGLPSRATDSVKLLHYHGLAAMNTTLFPTWDSYFASLLEQSPVTYSIRSNRGYLPDIELEIVPASLCSRLVSVREQIAREFAKDLDVITASMGRKALEGYVKSSAEAALLSSKETDNGTNRTQRHSGADHDGEAVASNMDDVGDLRSHHSEQHEPPRRLQRPSLYFLELPTDSNAVDPSPLRKGNFDLLLLLCTQEAIHRVLSGDDGTDQYSLDASGRHYLQNFYLERLYSHFLGSVPYGRADDFVEELLWQPPRLVRVPPSLAQQEGREPFMSGLFSYRLVDPLRLAEAILRQREIVALEWKCSATEAPFQHMSIKRMQLNLLMGRPANMTLDALG
jgi:hypothetical protein